MKSVLNKKYASTNAVCGWLEKTIWLSTYSVRLSKYQDNKNIICVFQVNMSLERSDFDKTMYKEAMRYPWQSSSNQTEYRLFRKITDIGTSALDDVSQLKKVSKFYC